MNVQLLPRLEKPNVSAIRDQLYESLKSLVRSDRCAVGQKLPTSRELAVHFNVSLATAQAAIRLLQNEGLVSCEVGRGTYVRRTLDPKEAPARRATIPTVAALVAAHERFDLQQPGSQWTSGILYGMQQALMEHGCALHLIPFYHPDTGFAHAEDRISKLVPALSGLITFPFPGLDRVAPFLDSTGLPWLTVNQYAHRITTNFVTADYYGGGVEVGKLFGKLDCRRVLFLKMKPESYSGMQKENGLRDGLSTCGIPASSVEVRECAGYLFPHGFEMTARYLREANQPPQAIFTTGDLLALGAIKAAQERGLRVPDDVAVVGSTGIEAGEHSAPTLTTVQLPMVEMGREAVRMLRLLSERDEKQIPGKILPVQLIQRGSTLPLPGGA